MNSNNRIAATLYSLGTYLSQDYIYNLHKGDDVDDNNNNVSPSSVAFLF